MKWPNWQPNQPLAAKDFHAWEDFLLSPMRIASFASGLEDIDLKNSVTSDGNQVRVTQITGLTHSGFPVVLSEGESLQTETGEATELHLGITVCTEVQEPVGNNSPEKLTLVISQSNDGLSANTLYLGHWTKNNAGIWELDNWPLVRRMAVLLSHSGFADFVQPLTNRLNQLKTALDVDSTFNTAVCVHVSQLEYNWCMKDLLSLRSELLTLIWIVNDARENEFEDVDYLNRQQILATSIQSPHEMTDIWNRLLNEAPILLNAKQELKENIHYTLSVNNNTVSVEWKIDEFRINRIEIQRPENFTSLNLGRGTIATKDDHLDNNGQFVLTLDSNTSEAARRSTVFTFEHIPDGVNNLIKIWGVF